MPTTQERPTLAESLESRDHLRATTLELIRERNELRRQLQLVRRQRDHAKGVTDRLIAFMIERNPTGLSSLLAAIRDESAEDRWAAA
jgi:hypothetical protein